jgi:hypothetical protein
MKSLSGFARVEFASPFADEEALEGHSVTTALPGLLRLPNCLPIRLYVQQNWTG